MATLCTFVCVSMCVCLWAYFTAKVAAHKHKNKTNRGSSPVCSLFLSLSVAGNLLATSASLLPLKLKLKTVQTFFTTPNRKQNRRNVLGCPFECCGNNNTHTHTRALNVTWVTRKYSWIQSYLWPFTCARLLLYTGGTKKESWQLEPSSMAAILRASVAWLSTEGSGE